MKLNKILVCLTLLSLVTSCRTIKEADFDVTNPLGDLLPPMEGNIDLKNLKDNISYGEVRISGRYNGIIQIRKEIDSLNIYIYDLRIERKDLLENPERYVSESEFIPEERVEDIIKLFAREMNRKNSSNDTTNFGSVNFRLQSFNESRNRGYLLFSLWTVCLPNLVGFPLTEIYTGMIVQISILDKNLNVVKEYNAAGSGSAFLALYWGYGSDVWRKASLVALKDAMSQIKAQIKKDREKLKIKLTNQE